MEIGILRNFAKSEEMKTPPELDQVPETICLLFQKLKGGTDSLSRFPQGNLVETEGIATPSNAPLARPTPGGEISESRFVRASPHETASRFPAAEISRSIPSFPK